MREYLYDSRIGKVLILKPNVKTKAHKEKSVNVDCAKTKNIDSPREQALAQWERIFEACLIKNKLSQNFCNQKEKGKQPENIPYTDLFCYFIQKRQTNC